MFLSEYKSHKCLGFVWCNWGRKRFRKRTPARKNIIFENVVMWVVHNRVCVGMDCAYHSHLVCTTVCNGGTMVPMFRAPKR